MDDPTESGYEENRAGLSATQFDCRMPSRTGTRPRRGIGGLWVVETLTNSAVATAYSNSRSSAWQMKLNLTRSCSEILNGNKHTQVGSRGPAEPKGIRCAISIALDSPIFQLTRLSRYHQWYYRCGGLAVGGVAAATPRTTDNSRTWHPLSAGMLLSGVCAGDWETCEPNP